MYYGSEVLGAIYKHDKFGRGVNVSVVTDMHPPYAVKVIHDLRFPKPGGTILYDYETVYKLNILKTSFSYIEFEFIYKNKHKQNESYINLCKI